MIWLERPPPSANWAKCREGGSNLETPAFQGTRISRLPIRNRERPHPPGILAIELTEWARAHRGMIDVERARERRVAGAKVGRRLVVEDGVDKVIGAGSAGYSAVDEGLDQTDLCPSWGCEVDSEIGKASVFQVLENQIDVADGERRDIQGGCDLRKIS